MVIDTLPGQVSLLLDSDVFSLAERKHAVLAHARGERRIWRLEDKAGAFLLLKMAKGHQTRPIPARMPKPCAFCNCSPYSMLQIFLNSSLLLLPPLGMPTSGGIPPPCSLRTLRLCLPCQPTPLAAFA